MKKRTTTTAQPRKLVLRCEAIATLRTLEQPELPLVQGALQVQGSGTVCTNGTHCQGG
jgi:hypothetical protein